MPPTPPSNNNTSLQPSSLIAVHRTDSTRVPLSEAERRRIEQIFSNGITIFNCDSPQPPSLTTPANPGERQFNLFDKLRPNNPEKKS